MMNEDWGTAYLSNQGEYTSFSYGETKIRFLTGKRLYRYVEIREWDHGYLVVMCRQRDGSDEEDYIDLLPILSNLYIDSETFLEPIKEVQLRYD